MKVLVTGGAGFIGQALLARLPDDVDVCVVDLLDPQVHDETRRVPAALEARATCVVADVRDSESYAGLLDDVEVIVHLAAQTGTGQSMYRPSHYIQHNVEGTSRLLEIVSARGKRVRRIVLASSRAVYGEGRFRDRNGQVQPGSRRTSDLLAGRWEIYDASGAALEPMPALETDPPAPVSIYGFTKAWQEQLVDQFAQLHDVESVVLRLQNVYGPKQQLRNPYAGIVGWFASQITQSRELELFEDGRMTRDFVYIEDVAEAFARAILQPAPGGGTFNVASGRSTTLTTLVEELARLSGVPARVQHGGRFRQGDVRHCRADVGRFARAFGPLPSTPLEHGLREYLRWSAEHSPAASSSLAAALAEMASAGILMRSR